MFYYYYYYINASLAPDKCINTYPTPEKCLQILLRGRKGVFKYFLGFSGAGEEYLNTSPALEKNFYNIYLSDPSPAQEKPGKYLYSLHRPLQYVNIWSKKS